MQVRKRKSGRGGGASPKPGARVDEHTARRNVREGTNSVNEGFAPRCDVLRRVQGGIGRCNFDVKYHDLAAAELSDGIDEVLGLRLRVLARVAEVVRASATT